MVVVGVTGGIGSGKSTVCRLLAQLGPAVVLDADLVARQVTEPGGAAYDSLVDRFGLGVVGADGRLDRPALAAVVFGDPAALADLNAIVHPAVRAVIAERVAAVAEDRPVVVEIPLLVESGSWDLDGVIVVDCPVELAVARVVAARGVEEGDVRRRVATQATRQARLAQADFVILNDGTLEDLRRQVEAAWAWMQTLRPRR